MKKWNVLGKAVSKDNVLDGILKVRNIQNAEEFLNPKDLKTYISALPKNLRVQLKKAAGLILGHVRKGLPLIIHGDYDADGICATAVLYKTLSCELGYKNVYYFIPNRFEHGYGLSRASIDASLGAAGNPDAALFVTVDCGITSANEIKYARSLGHKVIITDHHQKPPVLPKANCIVWYDKVVGSALAWLLAGELGSKDEELVALVALATVTDLHPVLGFNRFLVKEGLRVLNTRSPVGLSQLVNIAGKQGVEITTYDLGWVIGPRLNASGRLVDGSAALKLLLEQDSKRAYEIALQLSDINTQRQDKTLEMYDIADTLDPKDLPRIIVSHDGKYHEGIIGLVAARLAQKYFRPSIVISLAGEYAKGSARSIPGVNIIELLRKIEPLFENVGGHPMAAGFTIKKENIKELKSELARLFVDVDESLFVPSLNVDLEIPTWMISLDLIKDLEKLKPFGLGNEQPLFLSRNMGVVDIRAVGKENQHLSLKLYSENLYYKAIYFNGADFVSGLRVGDTIDLVYSLNRNIFNGKTYIDLVVKDFERKKRS